MSFINTIKKKWEIANEPTKKDENITLDVIQEDEKKPQYPPVNEDELIKRAESAILTAYPDILNLKVWCSSAMALPGKIYYLNISWNNGIKECFIADLINPIIKEYPLTPILFNITEFYKLYPARIFSDQIILETARKYADCISKDLPINMHNIHCFKVGNVSLYDLAVGELRLKDVV